MKNEQNTHSVYHISQKFPARRNIFGGILHFIQNLIMSILRCCRIADNVVILILYQTDIVDMICLQNVYSVIMIKSYPEMAKAGGDTMPINCFRRYFRMRIGEDAPPNTMRSSCALTTKQWSIPPPFDAVIYMVFPKRG